MTQASNPSLEPTRYGRRRLAAPGNRCHFPSAASQHLPPRAAWLDRQASATFQGYCHEHCHFFNLPVSRRRGLRTADGTVESPPLRAIS